MHRKGKLAIFPAVMVSGDTIFRYLINCISCSVGTASIRIFFWRAQELRLPTIIFDRR